MEEEDYIMHSQEGSDDDQGEEYFNELGRLTDKFGDINQGPGANQAGPGQRGANNDPNSQAMGNNDQRTRGRRRSKNDAAGRDYKCGCSKRYLSYPALYTHIKQKHDGRTPAGTVIRDLTTGRGRGRPKKIQCDGAKNYKVVPNLDDVDNAWDGIEIDIFNPQVMVSNEPSKNELRQQCQHKLEEELKILKEAIPLNATSTQQKSHPCDWFCDVSHISFSLSKMREIACHPSDVLGGEVKDEQVKEKMALQAQVYVDSIYPIVADILPAVDERFNNHWVSKLEHDGLYVSKYYKATMYIISMTPAQKQSLKIDDVLALYLIDLAEALPSRFYKMGACFIQLLRSCINKYAFQVLTGIRPLDDQMFGQQQNIQAGDFTNAIQFVDRIEAARNYLVTQKNQKSSQETQITGLDTAQQASGMESKTDQCEQKRDLSIVTNNIEIVPHMANLFILKYLPEKCNVFPEAQAICFMKHLVSWLNTRRFLNLELIMNKATNSSQVDAGSKFKDASAKSGENGPSAKQFANSKKK